MSVAKRVSEEMGVELGTEVGPGWGSGGRAVLTRAPRLLTRRHLTRFNRVRRIASFSSPLQELKWLYGSTPVPY